ncbi:MAG: hypothetical protein JSV44_03795 [Candidatus Zixiibacteriota bacterium]|nr:MAG: hypothetical protein JSV44_03795 [candidate division Zixibacteria bacterium]
MIISPIASNGLEYTAPVTSSDQIPSELPDDEITVAIQESETSDEIPDDQAIVEDNPENDEAKIPGVIRLLQQGHFKGVADVRLRINYFDQISELERNQATAVLEAGVAQLIEGTTSEIGSLVASEDLDAGVVEAVNEAQQAFINSVPEVLDKFAGSTESDSGQLIDQLQSDFDELVTSLETALAPTPEEEPEEPAVIPAIPESMESSIMDQGQAVEVEEPVVEEPPQFAFDEFLANLTSYFQAALNELATALENVRVLPELSEPHGNGVAYEKFLAIYNELRGIAGSEPPTDAVNTVT